MNASFLPKQQRSVLTLHGPFQNKRTVFRLIHANIPNIPPMIAKKMVDIAQNHHYASIILPDADAACRNLIDNGLIATLDDEMLLVADDHVSVDPNLVACLL